MRPDPLFDLSGRVAVVTGGLGSARRGLHGRAGRARDARREPRRRHGRDPGGHSFLRLRRHRSRRRSRTRCGRSRRSGVHRTSSSTTPGSTPPRMRRPRRSGPFETYPEASFDAVLDVNVKGAFLCCQVIGGAMAREGRGSIVNISSIYGLLSPVQDLYAFRRERGETFVKPVAYSVSKSAVLNLTRYLATYWASAGVRVNTLTLARRGERPAARVRRGVLRARSHGPHARRRRGARRGGLPRLRRVVVRHRLERRRRRRLVGLVNVARATRV